MMTEGHRLRGLQMGEAGHHRVGMLQRTIDQCPLQRRKGRIDLVDGIAHEQTEVGRDLVVARTRGMQAAGGRADQLAEPALHIHVNVFERTLECERPLGDL